MSDKYNDIINLPHYEPKKHPRMSIHARAAQFAPFAALVGLDAAIDNTSQEHVDEWNRSSGRGLGRGELEDL